MHEQPQIGHITTAMDVCDVEGEKIGTVALLYRREPDDGAADSQSDRPEILEVKTGPSGWGEHLYIPVNAVQDLTQQSLFLSRRKRDLDQTWRNKLADLVPLR
jgi:hypothetical protein